MGKRKRNRFMIVGAVLFALLLGGGLLAYREVLSFIQQKSWELLGTEMEFVDFQADFSPPGIHLRGVQIHHPDRKKEKISELNGLSFQLEDLSSKRIKIHLHQPRIVFITNREGDWELAGRIPLIRRGEKEGRLTPLDVEELEVSGGEVEFRDYRVSQPPVITRLQGIDFRLKGLRHATPENPHPSVFEAEFKTEEGARFEIKGKGSFLSPKTSFQADLKVQALPLPRYAAYYQGPTVPVHIQSGSASFAAVVLCEEDQLKAPVHAEIRGLQVELKKNKSFQFGAEMALDSLRNSRGNVEMDLMISGDLRRPRFAILTDFEAAFKKAIGDKFKGVGKSISEGTKSGFRKVKGIFTKD